MTDIMNDMVTDFNRKLGDEFRVVVERTVPIMAIAGIPKSETFYIIAGQLAIGLVSVCEYVFGDSKLAIKIVKEICDICNEN